MKKSHILLLAFGFIAIHFSFMFMTSSSHKRQLAENNLAWAEAARPIFEARDFVPSSATPEDLRIALDANSVWGYSSKGYLTQVSDSRKTEIVIRKQRTLGEIFEDEKRFHKLLANKPSF